MSCFTCLFLMTIRFVFGRKTTISIDGTNFFINGKITYENATNKNVRGLLINSRMINAIFDNSNTQYNYLFEYPDTHKWDPQRNTNEYVSNLTKYLSYGMLSFSVGLQGGNPFGFGHNEPKNISGQPWVVSAFTEKNGDLITPYFNRLTQILKESDDIGMIPIIQIFYNNQVMNMSDNAVMSAINNTFDWLMDTNYTNIIFDIANECGNSNVKNTIVSEANMPNIIKYIRSYTNGKYLLSSSVGLNPSNALIEASDFVLMHADGHSPTDITSGINYVWATDAYKKNPKPILITEDNDYDFDKDTNNFKSAIDGHTSWGVFVDCNSTTAGDYIYGYQCVPANWDINTPIKQGFFNACKNYAMT